MTLDRDRRDWQELAELDPYWAALTDASKRSRGWELAEFVASGTEEIDGLLNYAATLGYPARQEAALDFGCGPGRLTRALAARFRSVVGIDLSERMVDEARILNRDVENCRFVAGEHALGRFEAGSFDLVYSNLALQHVSDSDAIATYVSEFVRVLAPEGLLAFQLPSHLPRLRRVQPRRRLYHALRRVGVSPRFLYRRLRLDPVRLQAVSQAVTVSILERAGAHTVRVDEATWPGGIRSATYFATT